MCRTAMLHQYLTKREVKSLVNHCDMSQGCFFGTLSRIGPINRSNRIQEGVQQGTKI
jgi:hypothetical protein